MNVRSIPRTFVSGYLRLARVPIDLIAKRRGEGAEIAVDRIDATARSVAGTLLGDSEMQEDGGRRRDAADERMRALRLRGQAEQQRRDASGQAGRRRERAQEKRDERKQQAVKTETRRKQAARKDKRQAEQRSESRARRARMDALDTKADALEEKDEALTARDEAKRLGQAAARAKMARKRR